MVLFSLLKWILIKKCAQYICRTIHLSSIISVQIIDSEHLKPEKLLLLPMEFYYQNNLLVKVFEQL